MRRFHLISAALAGCMILGTSLPARGQSPPCKVIVYSSAGPLHGTIDSESRDELSFMQTSPKPATTKTLEINDIKSIVFTGEPKEMGIDARGAAEKGNYLEAVNYLNKVPANEIANSADRVHEEFDYLKAYYAVRQAINGQYDANSPPQNPTETAKHAGEDLRKFLTAHSQSMHYYEAKEALGDLLVSIGNYDVAQQFYKTLADSPWPDYHARADLLRGRALQQAGKYDEALAAFDAVIRAAATGPLGEQQTEEAKIVRTYSMAGAGKAQEAIKLLNDVVAANDGKAEDKDAQRRLAQAYDALGNCYRKLNDNKQALWAYLHVEVEYPNVPDAHAEALANLVPLWTAEKKPDRARAARELLRARYPLSHWNRRPQ